MYILTIPMATYILMIITAGLLVTLGVDKKNIDTIGMFMIYLQCAVLLVVLRLIKRKVTK
jgi:hypothetical protein